MGFLSVRREEYFGSSQNFCVEIRWTDPSEELFFFPTLLRRWGTEQLFRGDALGNSGTRPAFTEGLRRGLGLSRQVASRRVTYAGHCSQRLHRTGLQAIHSDDITP